METLEVKKHLKHVWMCLFFISLILVIASTLGTGNEHNLSLTANLLVSAFLAAIASSILTLIYYLIRFFVQSIRSKFGENVENKIKYILTGLLLTNSMPVLGILIYPLAALVVIYTLPLTWIDNLLNLGGILYKASDLVIIPNGLGYFIIVPLWTIIGGFLGLYSFKKSSSSI